MRLCFLMTQSTNHILNKAIAEKVKQLRKQKDVTLEVFYFDTGIHLARIEQGKTNITVATLQSICDYFETDLATFFSELTIPTS